MISEPVLAAFFMKYDLKPILNVLGFIFINMALKFSLYLKDENNYSEWKKDLEIWQLFTDIEKTKQGLAIYLTISSHARECIRDLKLENISSENHVKIINDKG